MDEKVEKKYNFIIYSIERQIQQNNIIGNELLKYYDDIEFYKYVNEKAEDILINAIDSPLMERSSYYIVIISLSFIALKYYDGNFWDYIEREYTRLYKKYKEQKIQNKIREIIALFDVDTKRQISYPIANAIVPEYYLDKYFEFMFDIYKINFQTSLPENIYEELEFIFNGLADSIIGEKDELEINITNKTYKLIKTTLNIIKSKENLKELINVSSIILNYIDAYWWNDVSIDFEKSTYFKNGFSKWINQNKEIEINKENNIEKNKDKRSAWKPKFKLIENEIYLITPIHRIPKSHNPERINIFVCNGDEPLSLEEKPIVEESIGGYIVKPQNVRIDQPIGKLTYILYDGTEEIYNSLSTLYRDYIAFNEDGNEIKNNTDYSGDLIIASDSFENSNISILKKYEKYMLGEIICQIGDFIRINNTYLSLSNRMKPEIIGNIIKDVTAIKNDEKIKIFYNVRELIFETEANINKVALFINGVRRKIKDFTYDVEEKNNIRIVKIKTNTLNNGYYDIKIFNMENEKNIAAFSFIIDSKLDWNYEKIKEKEYEVIVDSYFELSNELGEKTDYFYLNIKYETEPDVFFYDGNIKFKYEISLPISLYKIDNQNWCEFGEYIWKKDIKIYSKMLIKNIKYDSVFLCMGENKICEIACLEEQIDLVAIYNLSEEENLCIVFEDHKVTVGKIAILCSCRYDKDNSYIKYDMIDNIIQLKTCYLGRENINIKVIDAHSNINIYENEISNGKEIEIANIRPFYTYKIIFEEKKNNFFEKNKEIYSELITLFNINRLEGRFYRLEKAYYGDSLDNLKEIDLYNTYVWIDEKIDDKKYKGRVYQQYHGLSNFKNNINPVIIEILSDNINKSIEVTIVDEEEDGLYLDTIKRTIYNGQAMKLDDIYSYDLLLGRRENE